MIFFILDLKNITFSLILISILKFQITIPNFILINLKFMILNFLELDLIIFYQFLLHIFISKIMLILNNLIFHILTN